MSKKGNPGLNRRGSLLTATLPARCVRIQFPSQLACAVCNVYSLYMVKLWNALPTDIPRPKRPVTPSEPQPYVPDYRPVIKALKDLTRAFEAIQNREVPDAKGELSKKRSKAAHARWVKVPEKAKRRAHMLPAQTAKAKKKAVQDVQKP